jgi:hypothetical protein
LAPSLPDQAEVMLPWQKLLRHESYFPRLPNKPEQPSTDELIEFLTSFSSTGKRNMMKDFKKQKRFSIEQLLDQVEQLKTQQENVIAGRDADMDKLSTNVELVIQNMSLLKNYPLPGWEQYTLAIQAQVNTLTLPNQLTPQARLDLIRDIVKNCETLRRHTVLFNSLEKDSPLSSGKGFKGTRHCEVCIASLVGKPGPTAHEELLKDFAVSHISMLCLDVC